MSDSNDNIPYGTKPDPRLDTPKPKSGVDSEERVVKRTADNPLGDPTHPHVEWEDDWPPKNLSPKVVFYDDPQRVAEREAAEKDPWKHRSKGMVCATCMWCVMKVQTQHGQNVTTHRKLGRCRRRAPTMNGYPAVFENDWCGDHKLDENKLR